MSSVVELTCIACDIGVLHTCEEDSYEGMQVLTPSSTVHLSRVSSTEEWYFMQY